MAELILNRYDPIDTAGVGGFGTVIVAWDTRIRRKVAIKCIELRESYAGPCGETINIAKATAKINGLNSQATQVIQNEDISKKQTGITRQPKNKAGEQWAEDLPGLAEARTAAMIQDANIVSVYDFELENNTAYIIMEYVEGVTLSDFLYQHGDDLTLDMLTCIFSGISRALSVAHGENVLHLDIKPDNVLIDNKGKVKVTDFGLATLADEFGFGTADAGTIGYMPPEQMRQENLDLRTDEWALASITYEMLTGTNPFDAKDLKSSLNNIYDRELACPSEYWQDIDPMLDDVVFRALSPEKEKRYASVSAFSEDIMHFLGNPKAGQRQISAIMKEATGEIVESEEINDGKISKKTNLFDGFTSSLTSKIASRLLAAIMASIVCYTSIQGIDFFGGGGLYFMPNIYAFIAFGVVVVGCAVFPLIGVSVSLLLKAASYFFENQILVGVVMAILVIAWACYIGYKDIKKSSPANILAVSVVGDLVNFSCAGAFLAGIFCKPIESLVTTCLSAFICVIAPAILNGQIASYQPWIISITWIVGAVIISLCFQARIRFVSILGCVLAFTVVLSGVCVANYFDHNMMMWQPQGAQILPVAVSGIASIVLAFFLPLRQPEDIYVE